MCDGKISRNTLECPNIQVLLDLKSVNFAAKALDHQYVYQYVAKELLFSDFSL